jgi:hypothetical protein
MHGLRTKHNSARFLASLLVAFSALVLTGAAHAASASLSALSPSGAGATATLTASGLTGYSSISCALYGTINSGYGTSNISLSGGAGADTITFYLSGIAAQDFTVVLNAGVDASGVNYSGWQWYGEVYDVGGSFRPVLGHYHWDGTTLAPLTSQAVITLVLVNNLNTVETVSCTGTSSQTMAASSTHTLTFTVNGTPGSAVTLGCSPDSLVYDNSYDPITLPPSGSAAFDRAGHVGAPKVNKKIHATFVNYAASTIAMVPMLDGAAVGHVDAGASLDGITPAVTSYDWVFEMSSSSTFTFDAPNPHTSSVDIKAGADLTTYTVKIDVPLGASNTSTTATAPDGTVTFITTNPSTGTTTIDHSTPGTPTNTDTNPATALGGGGTAGTGATGNYNNTTAAAGSAAAQDSSNSLAAIAANTKALADDKADEKTKVAAALAAGNESTWAGQLAIAQAKANAAPKIDPDKLPGSQNASGGSVPSTRPGLLGSWQIAGHDIKITMDPTDSYWNTAHNLLHACRELLLWAMVIAFCWDCMRYGKTFMANLPLIPQVTTASDFYQDKVPLLSMLKGWFSASVLVGASVIAIGLIIGLINSHVGSLGFSMTTIHQVKDMSATGGGGAILNDYVPLLAMCELAVARILFGVFTLPIYQAAAATIKFARI